MPHNRSLNYYQIIQILFIIFFSILLINFRNFEDLWIDEFIYIQTSEKSFFELLKYLFTNEVHPHLFYYFKNLSTRA